jgi:tetratricopeptide (TPR) repeat protein
MQTKVMRSAIAIASICAAMSAFGQIKWSSNYQAAMDQAKTSNKLVMVKFYTTWDPWGKRMDADTFEKQTVVALAAKVIPVQIDVEKEGAQLGKKYKVTNYPTILFVNKDGVDVGTIDGYEGEGEFVKHVNVFLKDHADEAGLRDKYKSNPKNLDAIAALGVIEANRYHVDAAINFLHEAEAVDPTNETDKLSDLYNAIADHYQNASKFDPAIAYFKKAGDTTKVTDKKAYAWLSIATCYMTMDRPTTAAEAENLDRESLIKNVGEHYKAAKPFVEKTLKLPNLKAEDKKIALDDLKEIDTFLKSGGGGE